MPVIYCALFLTESVILGIIVSGNGLLAVGTSNACITTDTRLEQPLNIFEPRFFVFLPKVMLTKPDELNGELPERISKLGRYKLVRFAQETKHEPLSFFKLRAVILLNCAAWKQLEPISSTLTRSTSATLHFLNAVFPIERTLGAIVIFADASRPSLAGEKEVKLPKPESSGNPWWTMAVVVLVLLILGWLILTRKISSAKTEQEQEIATL